MTLAGGARAAPITFEFKGEVTLSEFGTIPVGSAVTGSYTFDSELDDQNPSSSSGFYGLADLTITFVDGSSIGTSTATFIITNNVGTTFVIDGYIININTPDTLTGSFAGLEFDNGRLANSIIPPRCSLTTPCR